MRLPMLVAALAIAAISRPAAAEPPHSGHGVGCTAGARPIKHYSNWSSNSDAVCDYGFVEVNRRLAQLIGAPSGDVSIAWLQAVLAVPEFTRREGWEPNGFYIINAAHQVALAGTDNWEMIIATYQRRSEGDWGRKDVFTIDFLSTGVNPATEAEYKGRCLSEAEVLDRATAAGWRYVPGEIGSGTAGPIFTPGALVKDDGRSLRLVHLSNTSELPSRETLEATCAWFFSFEEHRDIRTPAK